MRTECKREKLEVQPCGARQVIKECGERGGAYPERCSEPGLWTFCARKGGIVARAPQRGAAYQPRVQPWVDVAPHSGVLKERRIDIDIDHTPPLLALDYQHKPESR